jgi:hypothetical protein
MLDEAFGKLQKLWHNFKLLINKKVHPLLSFPSLSETGLGYLIKFNWITFQICSSGENFRMTALTP